MKEINVDIIHENLFLEKPKLAFSDDLDYPIWKEQLKNKYIELLGLENISKRECDLNIEIEEVVDKGDYLRYRYTFESEKDSIVPCYLLIPKKENKKYPVCICLQGHQLTFVPMLPVWQPLWPPVCGVPHPCAPAPDIPLSPCQ